MNTQELTAFGLTESEAKIYHSLLKNGTSTVKEISQDCGFHRTNIYDILEQLKEKGLVTQHKEANVYIYTPTDPHNLYSILREKKELLDSIFPQIQQLYEQPQQDIQVEVYKGKEGMKSAFRDMIRVAKPMYAFGVKGQLREKLPVFAQQWIRDAKAKKLKYYAIYTEKNPPGIQEEIRYVSEELSGPVATFIYGDKININIWEPTLVSVVITSEFVAQMYKRHFDLLWKIAK